MDMFQSNFLNPFIYEEFMLAYRLIDKGEKKLFENETTSFKIIKNSKDYWYADPILFEHNDETYLFFEAYNKKRKMGEIGCCKVFRDGTIGEMKIIVSDSFHLSYPFVFVHDNTVYMIPETYGAKKILLYRCDVFPEKWTMYKAIADDCSFVDITLYEKSDTIYLMAARLINDVPHNNELCLFRLVDDFRLEECSINPIVNDITNSRPAGRIFNFNNKHIRPSQDCSQGSYGNALNFNIIDQIAMDKYNEFHFKKVRPENINVDKSLNITGIHTYASNNNLEVIDIKFSRISIILGTKIYIKKILNSLKSKQEVNR